MTEDLGSFILFLYMEITREFKRVLIDIFVRLAQIVFVAFIITPFVSGKFNLLLQLTGGIISFLSAGFALLIALTIKEAD